MVPKRIYLQYDPDGETTWCEEMINDDDIEYVIASELTQAKAELGRLRGLILNWYTEWGQNGMHKAFHALMKEAKELERKP